MRFPVSCRRVKIFFGEDKLLLRGFKLRRASRSAIDK
jgi:hypothetical protein